MQVNDSPAAPSPSVGTKEEVRSPDRTGDPPERSGQRFRTALDRKRRAPGVVPHEGASGAAMAGWFRAESVAAPPSRATGVAGASAARPVERVLIGSGPDGAEARIRIGAGVLAGTEIHLSSGAAGQAVEARLLTHAASSRQTLSLVMDEIRLRLRDRGVVLCAKAPVGRAEGLRADPDAPASGEPGRSPR